MPEKRKINITRKTKVPARETLTTVLFASRVLLRDPGCLSVYLSVVQLRQRGRRCWLMSVCQHAAVRHSKPLCDALVCFLSSLSPGHPTDSEIALPSVSDTVRAIVWCCCSSPRGGNQHYTVIFTFSTTCLLHSFLLKSMSVPPPPIFGIL